MVKPAARLAGALHEELVSWARAGVPNEACGIIAGDRPAAEGGRATAFYGLTNQAASPYRYLIGPDEQLRTMSAIDAADEVLWGIFHSHVRSPAVPSPTDIGIAAWPDGSPTFPGTLYLICSLADPEAPHIRAWTIRDGDAAEVPLTIE